MRALLLFSFLFSIQNLYSMRCPYEQIIKSAIDEKQASDPTPNFAPDDWDLVVRLGFSRNSKPTKDEIRTAYRKAAFLYHPARNPGDTVAKKNFIKIQEAYDILSEGSAETETKKGSTHYTSNKETPAARRIFETRGRANSLKFKKLTTELLYKIKDLQQWYVGPFREVAWKEALKGKKVTDTTLVNVFTMLDYIHYLCSVRVSLRGSIELSFPFSEWSRHAIKYLKNTTPETEADFHNSTNFLLRDYLKALPEEMGLQNKPSDRLSSPGND